MGEHPVIYIPLVAAAVGEWSIAAGALRKELGREPEANEVRVKLGWPKVIGEAEFHYDHVAHFASSSAAIPGTRFRIRVERQNEGPLKVTLLELPEA